MTLEGVSRNVMDRINMLARRLVLSAFDAGHQRGETFGLMEDYDNPIKRKVSSLSFL